MSAERVREAKLWGYTLGLVGVSVALGMLSGWPFSHVELGIVLFFGALNLAAEAFPVHLPFHSKAGNISVNSALIVAEIALFPPVIAGVLASLGTIRPKDVLGRTSARGFLFNRGQGFLAPFLAALVFRSLGGVGATTGAALVRDGLPLIVSGLLFSGLNVALAGNYIAVYVGKSFRSVWRTDISFSSLNHLGDLAMGLLLVGSYLVLGFLGPVLFFSPLLLSRWSMSRFVELREAYMSIVGTLTKTLEAKDPYTAGHSARVAEYAVDLGVQMRLSNRDLDTLYFAGMLHDIGKIAISDLILNKAGVLSQDEYALMQQHAVYSFNIVQNLQFLGKGIDWVSCHHERWDGQGFPHRLKGDEIPIGSRIISVVDTFDAMTSDRSYRKGSGIAEAEREIARVSGTQFDPEVVRVFLHMTKTILPGGAGAEEAAPTSDSPE